MFGIFRVKNHDFTQKNNIFSILWGAGYAPPGSVPGASIQKLINIDRNVGINLKEVIDRFIWTIELCHI